jgi:uncharacterized protein
MYADMLPRVNQLIEKLNLQAHPEGGFYAEVYRSPLELETQNGKRNLMTSIYFLLTSDNVSRFHQIKSDEMWFYHEGNPLIVHVLSNKGYEQLLLGPSLIAGHQPQQMVKAGAIFGSTVEGDNSYSLVSCVVAPGFDFSDFRLVPQHELLSNWPDESDIITRLT